MELNPKVLVQNRKRDWLLREWLFVVDMKTNRYCIPVEVEGRILLFDSFTNSFLMAEKERFYQVYRDGSFTLESLTDKERNTLERYGLLVPEDFCQRSLTLESIYAKRLRKTSYRLTVNPTMDCNLSCWYCYESHEAGSRIGGDVILSIGEHLKFKYITDKFETLDLGFFGGEPLLATAEVCEIIALARAFCQEKGVLLRVHFTTNGTLLNNEVLEALQDLECAFQITLDGDRARHNKIRAFKAGRVDSFDLIAQNLQRIQETIPSSSINLRINYDLQTLKSLSDIETVVDSLDKERVRISLHKVWQVDTSSGSDEDVFEAVLKFKGKGIQVSVQGYILNPSICYADCLDSCVINYNGDVYKCTARDFSKENRCGVLTSSGVILWDHSLLREYCMGDMPQMCQECALLPRCLGVCSQGVMEAKGSPRCSLNKEERLEDLILMHYFLSNKQVIRL